ncbi:MAG: phosphoglycerate kinase [Rhizobiales bacterium]|nr:phosphoglycerate kinase [Hyphomicrobiales bacterium]
MPKFRTLDDLDVAGKRVLVRCDLNVPMKDGKVTDATRIERSAETLKELSGKGARVIVLSHLGRPKDGPSAKRKDGTAKEAVNVPNLISLLRLAAVPLVVWLIANERLSAAFWLFVAAGVSDALDGYLARVLRQRTKLGAYLDPLADKMLLVCVFVTLGQVGAWALHA